MDSESVAQTLSIEPPIMGELYWGQGNSLLLLAPAQPLPSEVDYEIRFAGPLRDAAGYEFPPVEPLVFVTPPAILAVSPLGRNSLPSSAIEIIFDRPMDAWMTERAVQIAPEVPGSFAWQDNRLVFAPDSFWEPLSTYTVTVSTEALGRDQQPILDSPYSWSFQTGEGAALLDEESSAGTACETSSSAGQDLTVRPLLPQRLVVGDRVQIYAVIENQSTCLRRAFTGMTSDLLTVEGVTTRTLLLTAGERRVVSWMASAEQAGGGDVVAQAISGMDVDSASSHVIVQAADSDADPQGSVSIVRQYLDVEEGQPDNTVPIGQVVQVRLEIELPSGGTGIVVEDRPPGGLEPLRPQTGVASQPFPPYEIDEGIVRFSLPELEAGQHTLTYLALAAHGGAYGAPPAELYQTDMGGLWGRSAAASLSVDASSRAGLARPPGGGGGPWYYDPLSSCVGGSANPNDEPYDAVFFEEYGVNPFIDTDEDNLSTFAVDVDTGSYTVMRYYVNDGYLPPDESVRVEEYVNYFEQEYAPPAEGEGAFAIHLEGAPSRFGSEQHHLVRVGLQGYLPDPEARPDAVLTFVIDISGSMDRQDRLELVKDALQLLVAELRPTDRVGIAVYGSQGREILAHTPVSEGRVILAAIERLAPGGSTNAAEGLEIGYRMAAEAFDPEANNRVILCSDGVANVGNTGADSILAQLGQYADEGIFLTTVGFGMGNYNDVLMEQLADDGDGFYAYVDTLDEAQRLFVYDLPATLQTIARDARIQVEFSPSVVRSYRLIGYENRDIADEDFRSDEVDAGEIGLGHSVTALYELKFWEGAATAEPAMTVRVRYIDPDTAEVHELSRSISWAEFAASFEAASNRFQLTAVVAEYAEVLRESYWARESSLEDVLEEAFRVAALLPEDEEVLEFALLVGQAVQLEEAE
jgi:Ca-activated chloride channel family protein